MHGPTCIVWANLTPSRLHSHPGFGGFSALCEVTVTEMTVLDYDGELAEGEHRARLHCRFVLPLIHFIPDSLTYSVPLILKRQSTEP